MEVLVNILTACAPVFVALIGIIPSIVANRKKTEKSILDSNAALKEKIEATQALLAAHIHAGDEEKARSKRNLILRFYDEMCEKRLHSESHFEDILDDIDEYEEYCIKHPEFRNNRANAAMEYIKETYKKLKPNGSFLKHD